jgi:hypothetical protein
MWPKIPHLQHRDLKKFPTEMSFFPRMGIFPKSGNTERDAIDKKGGKSG